MSYVDGFTGDTMCRFSMQPLIDEVGQRPYPIARAELQQMLMDAYGFDDIHFGKEMVAVRSDENRATVEFADGTTDSGDIVIGADGARSLAREYVLGGPVARRYAGGYVNFNGLVEVDEKIGPATEWTTYVGDSRRVSVMPVAGNRFYFFFDVPMPEGVPFERGTAREVLAAEFADWAPGVQTLIAELDPATTNRVEILDLDPFDIWVKGRVAVLGDAAHNTTPPDIGQGGCSAMEDAVALQFAFRDHPPTIRSPPWTPTRLRAPNAPAIWCSAPASAATSPMARTRRRPPPGTTNCAARTAPTSSAASSATSSAAPLT